MMFGTTRRVAPPSYVCVLCMCIATEATVLLPLEYQKGWFFDRFENDGCQVLFSMYL